MFGGLFRLAVLGSPEAPRLDARFGVLLTEVRAGVEYVARLPRPLPSELIDDLARKLKELNDVAPTWARQVNDLYVWHARSWALSAVNWPRMTVRRSVSAAAMEAGSICQFSVPAARLSLNSWPLRIGRLARKTTTDRTESVSSTSWSAGYRAENTSNSRVDPSRTRVALSKLAMSTECATTHSRLRSDSQPATSRATFLASKRSERQSMPDCWRCFSPAGSVPFEPASPKSTQFER